MIQVKRIYEPASKNDGYRVLVDRLWPRGISKQEAHIDEWMREIAPSNDLRQWYQHEPAKWLEFQRRYARELKSSPCADLLIRLQRLASTQGTLTLLFASKEEKLNNAMALKLMLQGKRSPHAVK